MKTTNKKGTSHQDQLSRLKRIEGQVRGISNMIEEQRYCVDIAYQIKAIRSALLKVEQKVIEQHLQNCVKKAVSSKNNKERDAVVEEMLELMRTSQK